MMDNTQPGLATATDKSKRPLKSIRERLKGKEGRVRGNLMGKRVDFSARTVITADPNLSIDQVGVPRSVAMNLTFGEVVTPLNSKRLHELVINGPLTHPGAKFVIRSDGVKIDLKYAKVEDIRLKDGDIVERHLQDDDLVLFNRQPTLHKMSMMGHRVKVMPYSTFRLNLSVTSPYNADFDGDEMNLHLPQSMITKAELMELMMVPKNILSAQANRPVIAIVQDSLLGSVLLTRRDVFLTRDLMMNCLMHLDDMFDGKIPQPAILKPKPLWTGKQLFSLLIPVVNLVKYSKAHERKDNTDEDISAGDTKVIINQGELISGIADKNVLGTSGGSLIHVIMKEHNSDVARDFLGTLQRVVNYWLLQHGFTIGFGDTIADEATSQEISRTIQEAKDQVNNLVQKAQIGELKLKPGRTLQETFEHEVNVVLNEARNKAGNRASNSLSHRNNVKAMVVGGSKGTPINISQMIACVGQQNVEGKRIPAKFRHRTLPHFKQYDYGPETRGFVANSYLRGLTPQEFYFHAMGGREGIIDTAVKTSETGYIQRRLIKSMEDAKVQYDGTVRDSEGNVLQFLYGEDGMDGVKLEFQFFKILTDSDSTFDYKHKYELDEHGGMLDTFGGNYMSSKVLESFQRDPEKFSILQEEYEQLLRDRDMLRNEILYASGDEKICQPVNLDRLILTAQKLYNIDMRQKSDMDPCDVIENIHELSKQLIIIKGTDELSVEAQNNATLLFKLLLRSKLASKRVLRDHRLTEEAFQWVLGEILDRFMKAHAQPGEMCGALAAQSIGEPATQMTLNTFHFAGVSSKNVTLGVPRLKELINVSKNIKTPQLTVYLSESHRHDNEKAKEVQSQLEYTTLGTITAKSEIFYDPTPRDTVIPEDQQFVEDFYSMPDHEFSEDNLSPWLLRLELDYNMVTDKNLKMDEIGEKIMREFDQHIICIATDDNAEKLVLRIRQIRDEKDKLEGENASAMEVAFLRGVEEQLLNAMPLRGIPDIKKVFLRDVKTKIYTNDGQRVREEWVLDTEGINIQAVMAEKNVDFKRTFSNDINEILEVFGIEACRRMLLDELRKVIEFDDSYVNYRHLSMLVDVMTQKGELMPITRHGVGKSDQVGPLGRCTFEQSVEVILEASQFAMTDSLRSVSANIMLGQTAPIGTGSFDLYLDESQLKNAISMDSYAMTSGEFTGNYTPSDSYAHTTFGGATPFTPGYGGATPFGGQGATPYSGNMTPFGDGQFSPAAPSPVTDSGSFSPYQQSPFAPSPNYDGTNEFSPSSPNVSSPQHFSPSSPSGYATSPVLSPSSPNLYSPSGVTSPQSPAYQPDARYSPSSPDVRYSPSSPQYQSPASPSYSPSSPAQYASPSSPSYSPTTSPAQGYTTSPVYSPSSPANYSSPQSPQYSPSSPAANYSPSSPAYGSPSSPSYSPNSPAQYSPQSPQYSPSSPANYSPSSPAAYGSPSSPSYSPSSPAGQYSPQSPQYSPTSPR
eukprot:CAMPEP_0117439584 /NCGR_PEP_ID=MMETSP0759-20121206/2639_1 /TAXON_ID=63605 /ORGANISM="Percolomonas cosmopolitus, Strain WS" /LENGTH=1474 /DNA_ID=CAMNT_0005231301 /DNA_START=60 /DNA_END=4484 /DNA_ORIENTATION=-